MSWNIMQQEVKRRSKMNIKEITIDEMREDLAEREAMNMNVSDIIDMLMYGVGNPLNEVPDSEIKEEWENIFEKNS